ncbi:MAG: hypothetical protein PHR47_00755 [Candidatus Pacebacteria bacterium]|nr:hypothetical protein [Candidatus Paceibacterota bacterium]
MIKKYLFKSFLFLALLFIVFFNISKIEAATITKGKCEESYSKKLITYKDFNNSWILGKGSKFCSSGKIYSIVPNCTSYTNSIKCIYACMGNSTSNSVCSFYVKKESNCGSASSKSYANTPNDNLCAENSIASDVEDRNNSWAWTCKSYDGVLISYCYADKRCFKSGEYVSGSEECCSGLFLCPVSSGLYLGQCSERCAADCDYSYNPACGIDGKDYNNECLAKKFGKGVAYKGECKYNGAKCGVASETTGYSLDNPSNLCSVGNPSIVSGSGPWYWICQSESGSWGVSCFSIKKDAINGECGTSNGGTFKSQPSLNLCKTGTASSVNAANAWYWTCEGINGGEKSYCYAARDGYIANGSCVGSTFFNYKPPINICLSGIGVDLKLKNGLWTWTCNGIGGGTNASCQASYTFYPFPEKLEIGNCGAVSGISTGVEPTKDFCNTGYFKDFRWDENLKEWRWVCAGKGGGSSENCGAYYSASLVKANGVCGSASDSFYETAPTADLCAKGEASIVSGTGPWNWSCSGISGGNTVNCKAKKASVVNGKCGSATKSEATSAPTNNLCSSGTASSVSGNGPWYWTCFGVFGGKDIQCTAKTSEDLSPRSSPENYILLETWVNTNNEKGIRISLKDYGVKIFMSKGKSPYKNGITPDNPKDSDFIKVSPPSGWADASFFLFPENMTNKDVYCFDAWYKPEWENGKLSSASQFYSDCISMAAEYPAAPTNLNVKLYPVNIGGAIALTTWNDYNDTKNHSERYSTVIIRTKGISPYYPDESVFSTDPIIGTSCTAKGKGCPSYDIVANGNQKSIVSYLTKGNYCYTSWTRYCNGYYCYNTKKPTVWCFEVK